MNEPTSAPNDRPETNESTIRTGKLVVNLDERVVSVDDQPVLCEILVEYLESDGHRVTIAGSGEEALAKFREESFDLVITDKAMPGIG